MGNNNNNIILSCIDGSSFSESICDYSVWIAKALGAPLKFLHTIEHSQVPVVADLSGAIGLGSSEELLNELTEVEQNRSRLLIKKGNIMLQAAKQRAVDADVKQVELIQMHGSLSEALVDLEEEIRVLVIGIRGEQHEQPKKRNGVIGGQLKTTIRSLHKPILVVNKNFKEPKKIMLAYDGSEAANKALDMITSSPLFSRVPCHLVHVTQDVGSSQKLLARAESKLTLAGNQVTSVQLQGKLEDALVKYQQEQDIDITLMGAFSHNRVRGFLMGSFTEKMLTHTQQPLVLLR